MNKGKDCEGNSSETQTCNIAECPSKCCFNLSTAETGFSLGSRTNIFFVDFFRNVGYL